MTTKGQDDGMNIFVPLTKFNAFTGEFECVLAEERLDKSNEIMDYDLSKPEFEAWSSEFAKLTGGASVGNLRVMHQPVVAGKFTSMSFDDVAKQVIVKGEIVDPAQRDLAAKGVYTGLSVGGKYIKRWDDPVHKGATRYVARPAEGSLVDNPCMYGATFKVLKADGAEELHKFLTAEERAALEKTADELKPQDTPLAVQKWVASDLSIHDTKKLAEAHSIKTAAQTDAAALASPATVALGTLGKVAGEEPAIVYADPGLTADKIARWPLDVEKNVRAALTASRRDAFAKRYDAPSLAKVTAAIDGAYKTLIDKAGPPAELTKSVYTLVRIAEMITSLQWLQEDLAYEVVREGDGSTAPTTVQDITTQLIQFLSDYAAEEAKEHANDADFEGDVSSDVDVVVLALAASAPLRKLLGDGKLKLAVEKVDAKDAPAALSLLQASRSLTDVVKAGARHSSADLKRVQAIHDAVVGLGAECDAAKVAPALDLQLSQANARGDALQEQVTKLNELVPDLVKRLAKLEAEPAAPKGVRMDLGKVHDRTGTGDAAGVAEAYKKHLAELPEAERAQELMKLALSNPVSVIQS